MNAYKSDICGQTNMNRNKRYEIGQTPINHYKQGKKELTIFFVQNSINRTAAGSAYFFGFHTTWSTKSTWSTRSIVSGFELHDN